MIKEFKDFAMRGNVVDMAATGDWDGLANLQDRLKGGRRV